MKRKNALVTGGAGFVGSFLVEKLVKKNYQVTVVDNLSTGSRDNIKNVSSKIRFIRQDLEKFLNQNRDLSAYDYIFHLAANPYIPPSVKNPRFDFRQNFLNTFNLLENLRKSTKAPHLLNTSSAAVYGNPETLPIKETDPTVPISPYGASKLSAEHYAAVYSKLYNLKITNMRFFPVFGPRQKKQVIFDLILKIKRNPEVLEIFGDGSQSRDFIFVEDLAEAILLLGEKDQGTGDVYNMATGKSSSIAEVAKVVCKVCKAKPKFLFSGQNRPGDAEKWEVDNRKLKKLGFNPKTSLEEGIVKVKKWIEEKGIVKGTYD